MPVPYILYFPLFPDQASIERGFFMSRIARRGDRPVAHTNCDHNNYCRRSIRLKGYDYASEGVYFVTLCTNDHRCVFGDVRRGEMAVNACGAIVDTWWREIPNHFPNVEMDEFIVMPNHVHGIIKIVRKNDINNVGAGSPRPDGKGRGNRAPTLGGNPAPTLSCNAHGFVI